MKRIVGGAFGAVTSWMMDCNRSSNSPLYFVPATRVESSNDMRRVPFSLGGHWGDTRICAIPSAMAVFPTPGSPIKQTLFLRRRTKVRMQDLISLSRPWTISNSPSLACAVKSTPTSSKVFVPAPSPIPVTKSRSFSKFSCRCPNRDSQISIPLIFGSIFVMTAYAPFLRLSVTAVDGFPSLNSIIARNKCCIWIDLDPIWSAIFPADLRTFCTSRLNGKSSSGSCFLKNPPSLFDSPSGGYIAWRA
mmetsp:Transcript_24113/g.58988  ORF Transcript_24113/g.58988 Transcript_24113/m.58988 type:complete len:247 (-) Transcript_24113:383-1123(-)